MEMHPLRVHRLSKKLTLTELAREIGTTAAQLSRIELRRRYPSLGLAAKLNEKTGIPLRKFVKDHAA